jgi:hypothetical protein
LPSYGRSTGDQTSDGERLFRLDRCAATLYRYRRPQGGDVE